MDPHAYVRFCISSRKKAVRTAWFKETFDHKKYDAMKQYLVFMSPGDKTTPTDVLKKCSKIPEFEDAESVNKFTGKDASGYYRATVSLTADSLEELEEMISKKRAPAPPINYVKESSFQERKNKKLSKPSVQSKKATPSSGTSKAFTSKKGKLEPSSSCKRQSTRSNVGLLKQKMLSLGVTGKGTERPKQDKVKSDSLNPEPGISTHKGTTKVHSEVGAKSAVPNEKGTTERPKQDKVKSDSMNREPGIFTHKGTTKVHSEVGAESVVPNEKERPKQDKRKSDVINPKPGISTHKSSTKVHSEVQANSVVSDEKVTTQERRQQQGKDKKVTKSSSELPPSSKCATLPTPQENVNEGKKQEAKKMKGEQAPSSGCLMLETSKAQLKVPPNLCGDSNNEDTLELADLVNANETTLNLPASKNGGPRKRSLSSSDSDEEDDCFVSSEEHNKILQTLKEKEAEIFKLRKVAEKLRRYGQSTHLDVTAESVVLPTSDDNPKIEEECVSDVDDLGKSEGEVATTSKAEEDDNVVDQPKNCERGESKVDVNIYLKLFEKVKTTVSAEKLEDLMKIEPGKDKDKKFVKLAAQMMWGCKYLREHSTDGRRNPRNPTAAVRPAIDTPRLKAVQSILKTRVKAEFGGKDDDDDDDDRYKLSRVKRIIGEKIQSLINSEHRLNANQGQEQA